jgi:hypothetical protein
MGVVEKFLGNNAARDWDGLAECFSEQGFERIGPYVDVISSADEYLEFLRRVVPILRAGYGVGEVRTPHQPIGRDQDKRPSG